MPKKNNGTLTAPKSPPGMEHLVFKDQTGAGGLKDPEFGVITRIRIAELPHGRVVWVSRSHQNGITRVVAISDSICFVPNAEA